MIKNRLGKNFFENDAENVAKGLLGNFLCVNDGKSVKKIKILETEAYFDEKDSASHARFGKTKRSSRMWGKAGDVYIYLNYGLHFMLNFVTGKEGEAQAVLIRAVEGFDGPGKLTKFLKIDYGFKDENAVDSKKIWVERNENLNKFEFFSLPRKGIDFANKLDKEKKLRFLIK